MPTMELMKEIKQVFDPRNILNPGKLFPAFPSHCGFTYSPVRVFACQAVLQ